MERRETIKSAFSGSAQVAPAILPTSAPTAIPNNEPVSGVNSFDAAVFRGVGDFINQTLDNAVQKNQQARVLDGQMAHYQGKRFEELEMDGDKFAMDGYSLVEAQQMSSAILKSQEKEIDESAYELDPDKFREHFIGRAEAILAGGQSPEAVEMARQHLSKHMQVLADAHLTRHLEWKERENYKILESSLDLISRDATADEQLLSFAMGGEDSPTSALSTERRQAAVASGVRRAFDNDNPLAFQKLSEAGLLGANLSAEQSSTINRARRAFQDRQARQYNQEVFTAERDVKERAAAGNLDPMQAIEELSILRAERGLKVTAAEASNMYALASDGRSTQATTNALLFEAARLRGDRDTQVNLVRHSLAGSESSFNDSADRTNKDGRRFAGAVQMGQRRLDDWANATGNPRVTVGEYVKYPSLQRQIEDWHFRDILEHIDAKGYDKLVGTKIHGVEVTIPGLVAVAHLGGSRKGLRKFIEGAGKYNPADELDTTLLSYLEQHGNNFKVEAQSPQLQLKRAQQYIQDVRERVAAERALAVTKEQSEDNALLEKGHMNMATWKDRKEERDRKFGIDRSVAVIKSEASIITGAVDAAVTRLVDSKKDNAKLQYKLDIASAKENYELIADYVKDGKASFADLEKAESAFNSVVIDGSEKYGIPIPENQYITDLRDIASIAREASDKFNAHATDVALIKEAINTDTLGGLPQRLQDKAINLVKVDIEKKVQDLVASGDFTDEGEAAEWALNQQRLFLAIHGGTDQNLKRTLNGALSGPILQDDRNVSEQHIAAMQNLFGLYNQSPAAAYRHLDSKNRGLFDAVFHRTGGNLSLIPDALRTMSIRDIDPNAIKNPRAYIQTREVQEAIGEEVDDFLSAANIGNFQAAFRSSADLDQVFDSLRLDSDTRETVRRTLRGELVHEIEEAIATNPRLTPSELTYAAHQRLRSRADVVGEGLLVAPKHTDLHEEFLGQAGNQYKEQDGLFNTIVVNYLRHLRDTDETYGFINDLGVGSISKAPGMFGNIFSPSLNTIDDRILVGVRPFNALYDPKSKNILIEMKLPDGTYADPIQVNPREAGKLWLKKKKKEAMQ